MKNLILLSLFITNLALATDFNFTYFGNEGSTTVYLSCDYAKASTEKVLEDYLALQNVSVSCTGGINPFGYYSPVFIRASFDFPSSEVGTEFDNTSANGNCYFDTRLIMNITKEFKNNFKVVNARSYCFTSSSNYYYNMITYPTIR